MLLHFYHFGISRHPSFQVSVVLFAATSASSLSSAQSLPGWVMDAKDIEILQLQSGKPYLLGVGSFGTVCQH